jgi:hypothetical protein
MSDDHIADANKMVSDTPATDVWTRSVFDLAGKDPIEEAVQFARSLERRLNAADERIKRLNEGSYNLINLCEAQATKIHKLNEQIKQLEEASSNLVNLVDGVGSVRAGSVRFEHNGFRLKDTWEWCAFYVASNRAKEEKQP